MNINYLNDVLISRRHLLEQLHRQGFETLDHEVSGIEEIKTMAEQNMLNFMVEPEESTDENGATAPKAPNRKVYVHYFGQDEAVRARTIITLFDTYFGPEFGLNPETDTLILIAAKSSNINSTVYKCIADMWEVNRVNIVPMTMDRLKFQILDHELIPPHRIMSEEEVRQVMEKYKLKRKSEFPKISRFDPVARAIGARPDQVIEIMRPSKITLVEPYYRVCTNEVIEKPKT